MAAFVVTLNAINFGSGYFPNLVLRPGLSGYLTLAMGLKEHFKSQDLMSTRGLTLLDAPAVAAILR